MTRRQTWIAMRSGGRIAAVLLTMCALMLCTAALAEQGQTDVPPKSANTELDSAALGPQTDVAEDADQEAPAAEPEQGVEPEQQLAEVVAGDAFEAQVYAVAHVIMKNEETYPTTITVDKGTASGIAVGMVVVSEDGLVGTVSRADEKTADISTILDAQGGIACVVESTRDVGLLSIEGSADRGVLYYLPAANDIQPGDAVYTSGADPRYPKGVKIGEIEAEGYRASGESLGVRLSADFSGMTDVYILLPE